MFPKNIHYLYFYTLTLQQVGLTLGWSSVAFSLCLLKERKEFKEKEKTWIEIMFWKSFIIVKIHPQIYNKVSNYNTHSILITYL